MSRVETELSFKRAVLAAVFQIRWQREKEGKQAKFLGRDAGSWTKVGALMFDKLFRYLSGDE